MDWMPVQLTPKQARDFPLCPSTVPIALLDDAWCRHIHMQDAQTLAFRGGMSPQEIQGNIQRKEFKEILALSLDGSVSFLINLMLQ